MSTLKQPPQYSSMGTMKPNLACCSFVVLQVAMSSHAQLHCADWLPGNGRSLPMVNPHTFQSDAAVTAAVVCETNGQETLFAATSQVLNVSPYTRNYYVFRLDRGVYHQMGGDLGGTITCMAMHSGELYAGGSFPAKVVRWNGVEWEPLPAFPDASPDDSVRTIESYNGHLFAGIDQVRSQTCIVAFDGTAWTPLATSTEAYVLDMHEFQGELIVAGEMYNLNGRPELDHLVRFNGSEWSPMYSRITPGAYSFAWMSCLAIHNEELVVGGSFGSVDGVNSRCVIRWDGSSWLPTGSGIPYSMFICRALLSAGGVLYEAGSIGPFSDSSCYGTFGQWSGDEWEFPAGCLWDYDYNFGTWDIGWGNLLASFNDRVVVAGNFNVLGDRNLVAPFYTEYRSIASWDGTTWGHVTGAVDRGAYTLETYQGKMYVGGEGNSSFMPLYTYDGDGWKRLPPREPGLNPDYINTLRMHKGLLYCASESFDGAAPVLSAWDGIQWTEPAIQPNEYTWGLASIGDDLWVGGAFTMIGDQPIEGIARWNGHEWSAVGDGLRGPPGYPEEGVFAIAPFLGKIYAGGSFTHSGTRPLRAFAQWNGPEWDIVGGPMTADVSYFGVFALAEYEGSLYVGGSFTGIGGVPMRNLARWDGANWHAIDGPVLNDSVVALRSGFGSLFVGGAFNVSFGGENLNRLARWDGAAWHSLSGGLSSYINPYVEAFAVQGATLFIAGTIGSNGIASPQPHGQSVLRWGYEPVPGDANADGAIDMADVCSVLANFGAEVPSGGFNAGDADRNLRVNFADVTAVLRSFGHFCE